MTHPRAVSRGSWVIDQTHWDGLPDGHTRATSVEASDLLPPVPSSGLEPLGVVLTRRHAEITVATRPLTDYARPANASKETS